MGNRGPHKKPIDVKLAEGTYRKSRDGDPALAPRPSGEPRPTQRLTGEALKHWKRVLPIVTKMGVATEADSEALTVMCETWALSREALKHCKRDVLDGEAKRSYNSAIKLWVTLASRFGLTPSDRTRIQVEKNQSGVATRKRS